MMKKARHPEHGVGNVLHVDDGVATVDFGRQGKILSVLEADLQPVLTAEESLAQARWSVPLETAARSMALSIRSANDRWGVFTPARITLFPHQLWVCQKVLARWPARWLIADDVGLGKTIEAGLVMTPLISRNVVRRLLIVCPASLVDQWVVRLREMFDIRASRYTPEVDKPSDDFWSTHSQVVASLQTVRKDRDSRWERILDAAPWDLVVVDEAHHLSADSHGGKTLSYNLLERMQERQLIGGLLLFTGTPHRGKDYAFTSLLHLLDDSVEPSDSLCGVLPTLPQLMIRNNKQRVTDMNGVPLFKSTNVASISYSYSPSEAEFYEKLTEFIVSGRAYARQLDRGEQRTAMLLLTAMQKLAASSVAAVRKALENRKKRLEEAVHAFRSIPTLQEAVIPDDDVDDAVSLDAAARQEERLLTEGGPAGAVASALRLLADEIPALAELVDLASQVEEESRIKCLMELVERHAESESMLLFTEYKATQALIVSALAEKYGLDAVTFINGDGYLEGVSVGGSIRTIALDRPEAAKRFNEGSVRFLVCTEAASEGVDLHGHCSTLVHVDIPWNPMRMHQRVGRLNRIGQKNPVDVFILRNPDTVEGRIWECLEEKLERIGDALEGAMADPEDIRLLVLGMVSPREHNRLAEQALGMRPDSVKDWYDSQTRSFGGKDAIATVRAIFGGCSRFDFGADAPEMPRADLPDLRSFLAAGLRLRGRRLEEKDGVLSFVTPEQWKSHFSVQSRYEFTLDRSTAITTKTKPIGAGHKAVEAAIDDFSDQQHHVTVMPDLDRPLAVFSCRDKLSDPLSTFRTVVLGVQANQEGTELQLVPDWELVQLLGRLVERPDRPSLRQLTIPPQEGIADWVSKAAAFAKLRLPKLDLHFQRPTLELESVFWPATTGGMGSAAEAQE